MKYLRYATGAFATLSAAAIAVMLSADPVGAEVFKLTGQPVALTAGQVTALKGFVPNMPGAYAHQGYCSRTQTGWMCLLYGYGVDVAASQYLARVRLTGCNPDGMPIAGSAANELTGALRCVAELNAGQVTSLESFISAKWPGFAVADAYMIRFRTTLNSDTGEIGAAWEAQPVYKVTTSDENEIRDYLISADAELAGQVAQ